MENARRIVADGLGDLASDRSRAIDPAPAGLEKVLRFAMPPKQDDERGGALTARDFTNVIDVVHAAAESLKAAEARAREADARTQSLAQRATEELKSAEMRLQAAEARTRAAEARTQDAEARLKDAETWLRQIFSVISEEFPTRR